MHEIEDSAELMRESNAEMLQCYNEGNAGMRECMS